jgi:glycosyltransferase involved in cell wall biosynthesis
MRCPASCEFQRTLEQMLISIVIPIHNRLDLAISAIESVTAQTHHNVEIVAIDDGSTEDLTGIESTVARYAPRVFLIRQGNRGPAAARNAGWEASHGHYVAFLDADDLFLPRKLAAQLYAMESEGVTFCHTSYYRQWRGRRGLTRIASGGGNSFPSIVASCGIATPTVMLRRDLWDEGFRFPEEFRIGEDVVLWLRIAARHGVLGLDEALTIVRASPVSTAYDRAKQSMGVANILTAVRSTPELACYETEVERLATLASSLRADPDN